MRHGYRHALAAAAYLLLSWLVLAHGAGLGGTVLGQGTDPWLVMWFLSWWPFALGHHLYPLYTHLVWQPAGLNLGWTTSVPLLSLLAAPLTLTLGPVPAYNLLMLLAPACAAGAAYALCWRLTRVWPAALAGGYLYGFSAFEMAHSSQHLNLASNFCVPLLLLAALERMAGRLSALGFVLLAGGLLAAQFLISTELCATAMLVAALAWGLGWVVPGWRRGLAGLVPEAAGAGLLAMIPVSPVLYAMFALPRDIRLPPHWPVLFSADLLNLVVPTPNTALGGMALWRISARFPGFLSEQGAYLGLPLLLLLILFIRRQPAPQARFFAWLLVSIVLLALGPQLWLAGVATGVPLPWALVRHLPLLGAALPGRLMLYAALAGAVMAALYIAQAPPGAARHRALRLAAVACLALLPVPHSVSPVPVSGFFSPGRVQAVLGPQPRLLILPFGITGPSSFWQAQSGFAFAQTGGYLGYPPGALQSNMPLMRLYFGLPSPDLAPALARYCVATGTQYVVAGPGTPDFALATLTRLGWAARHVDDVTIYTVPGAS